MAATVLMPALSPTMEKGKLAKWLKKEGDTVKSGDILAEIETDKATMEIEAVDEGTLGKIMIAAGTEDVLVNTLLATILGEGEKAGDVPTASPPPAAAAAPATSPVKGEDKKSAAAASSSPFTGEVAQSAGGEVASSPRPSPSALPRKKASTSHRSKAPARTAVSFQRTSKTPPNPPLKRGRWRAAPEGEVPLLPPHHPTPKSSKTSPMALTTSCRMTACARSSRVA